jgi:hypothetical protein
MCATDHEHTFVWDGQELLPCACGANVLAIGTVLGAAADDARMVVGDAYYTGCRLRQELERLELWLFNAPLQVTQELEAMHPGVYLIHNDAPRPRTAVDDLRDSFDWAAWKADGIRVWAVGPTEDGYLNVGVEDDLETAQKKLDAAYGDNVIRVSQQGPIVAL